MPGGVHLASFTLNQNNPVQSKVSVDASAADALNRQLTELNAKSAHRAYFDFNHEDGPASFWPESFSWKETPAPGIYVKGEWSADGKAAIEGKSFRAFSPVFHVDNPKKKPARVVAQPLARLNMGGLVNTPAFKKISALWAKEAERPGPVPNLNASQPFKIMKITLAELKAKLPTLQAALTALQAKTGDEAATTAELSAAENEIALAQQRIENMEMRSTNAKTIVLAAVKRGAIPAQNTELQAKYQGLIEQDPANATLLEALPSATEELEEEITNGEAPNRLQAKEGLTRCVKAFGELSGKNAKIIYAPSNFASKGEIARQAAAIYARELSGKDVAGALAELMAADSIDANLGTLTGTLVAQRTIELFRFSFKLLPYVWQDFSELPAALNQQVETRVITTPAVQTYDASADANGLPKGWTTITAAVATDVPIKLDTLVGCPIRFGLDTLSSTFRRLFNEFAQAQAYAMAKYFAQKLYALMTPANFNAYAAVVAGTVPDAFATYPVGLGDFARSSLTRVESIFDPNEVPEEGRYAVLNARYHSQLGNDPSITQFYAAVRKPEIIEENDLPKMAGFKPIKAPNISKNNNTANLFGFFGHKAALAIMARLPIDLNQVLPGAQFGSVTTMVDPELGIPWQLVNYVNQMNGFAESRLQSLMGCAVGDKRGGLCGTTQ